MDLYNNPGVQEIFRKTHFTSGYSEKSDEMSRLLRMEGNELFQKKQFQEALGRFNACILHSRYNDNEHNMENHSNTRQIVNNCESVNSDLHSDSVNRHTSEEKEIEPLLALALANISAVFLCMKMYRECIADIDIALSQGFPINIVYKLFERKAKCFAHLKQGEKAIENFNKARMSLVEARMEAEAMNKIIKDIEKQIEKVKKSGNSGKIKHCQVSISIRRKAIVK